MKHTIPWNRQRAIDTECNGLAIYDPKVHAFMTSTWENTGRGAVRKLPLKKQKHINFKLVIEDPCYLKLFYNASFDIPILKKAGYIVKGPVIDVMFMVQMCVPDQRNYGLKAMARKFLKVSYDEEKAVKQWCKDHKTKDYSKIPDHIITPYAHRDAKYTLELFHYFWPVISELKLWGTLHREMKITRDVMEMERMGIPVDMKRAQSLALMAKTETRKLKAKLCRMVKDPEFNPNSPQQVGKHLVASIPYEDRQFTKTGELCTDKIVLMDTDTKFSWSIIEWRRLTKAGGTYLQRVVDGTDHKGRFRVSFNQTRAKTGRFSSSGYGGMKFNMQNVPRQDEELGVIGRIRECFVAPANHWLSFLDLDQVEMRITAHFSQDKRMLNAIHQGLDLHDETCKIIFKIDQNHKLWKRYRYLAKTLNFAVIYGIQARSFVRTVKEGTLGKIRLEEEKAALIIERYHEAYPGIEALFNELDLEVTATGGIRTPYGRFIFVADDKPHAATNYLVQGTAADYLKVRMIRMRERLQDLPIGLLLQIHDELVHQLPHALRKHLGDMKRIMESATDFTVPITCSAAVAKRWSHKQKVLV